MLQRIFLIFVLVLSLNSCSKKEIEYELKQIDTKEKLSELIIDDIKYRQQEDKK